MPRYRHGRKSGESGLNIFNLANHNKTPMLKGSIGRFGTNGCHSTIGPTLQRCKTLPRSGCGLTTMTAQIWPWAGSHPSSGWPWLHNVSTSTTLAKGEDYRCTFENIFCEKSKFNGIVKKLVVDAEVEKN